MNEYGRVQGCCSILNELQMIQNLGQEFGKLPGEAGSDLTDGVDSKSAGLSKWLHCRPLIIFGCLGRQRMAPSFILVC